MKSKILTGVFLLAGLLALTANAQTQDPKDTGIADTIRFAIAQPTVSATSQVVAASLYFFNTPQNVTNVSAGFGWDNPKFVLDSVVWSPEANGAFNLSKLVYYRNSKDSSNARRLFQCVGLRIFGDGIVASGSAKLIATYYFHTPSWTASDAFCISTAGFNKLAFTDLISTEYVPIWPGTTCVGNVITGVLQTSPGTLNFSGVAGGAAPPNQSFNVTEAVGDFIPYTAATATGWLTLTTPTGTTPGVVGVGINMAGLAAGDYQGTVNVTSAEAVNSASVTVNLHLNPANRPPVLDPIGNRQVDENSLLQFTVTATDPDGTIPALTTSALPGTATFLDNGNGTGTFSWTPTFSNAGAYPVTFTASDGSLTDFEAITITVNNVNRPPVLAAIGPQLVNEGVNLTFIASATDPDGTPLTFSAPGIPAGSTFTDHGNGTATFSWTPSHTDAGMYDFWVIVSDGGLADSEHVTVEVVDVDGYVLSPATLNFTAHFNSTNPADQPFHVSIGDGSQAPFMAMTNATWITINPTQATTPADIMVGVNIAGLVAGTYRDSIQIMDAPSQAASPLAYNPVWEMVTLTIVNQLVVAPEEILQTQSEGDPTPVTSSFRVQEEGGAAIGFTLSTAADWFTLSSPSGTTSQEIVVTFNTDLAPGTYVDSIRVASVAAANSPLKVRVRFTVRPCPHFVTPQVVYNTTIFAGETAAIDQNFSVGSTTEDEFPWAVVPHEFFTFEPASGTTAGDPSVHVTYSRVFGTQGLYADTARLVDNYGVESGITCPAHMLVIVNVTVNRPPSTDTVIVVNTPAVPGMRVAVPVLFTNSCNLTGLGLSLNWTGGMHLDSVSFVGSALAYVENKNADINNDLYDVAITMAVGQQALVPIGSQQLMATLYFALPCEISEGTYRLNLGAYPPLTPADVYFYRNCGGGVETGFPEYVPGAVIVGTASDYVCGYVVDPDNNTIEGATVELWGDYPMGAPVMNTMSSSIGGFAFDNILVIPFDLYAFKEGYYPGKVDDVNFGDKGVKIVLQPLPKIVTPTSQWVDYFCPVNPEVAGTMFLGAPVPVGAVVEAYTQNNLLVGQSMVTVRGKYGFMPVYRAYDEAGDTGARTGDRIHFTINGMDAVASGNTVYPAEYAQIEVCLEVRGTVEKVCTLMEGWNLISWNVNTDSDNILDVLAPIMNNVDVVLGFEQGGLTFDPDLQMFSTLHSVDHLSGYWVKIQGVSQIDLTITGLPVVESTDIPLNAGWNLVSYLPEESWSVEQALASISGITMFAYGFPNGQIEVWQPGGQFNQLETMDPCNGYWIKTNAPGVLIYSIASAAPAEIHPQAQGASLGSNGIVATTNWINLYSRDLKLDGKQVASGARITAYTVTGDHPVGSFTMSTAGQFGFMPVYADAAGENQVGLKAGDEFYLKVDDVKTSELFTWNANGDRVEVTELATANSNDMVIPDSYSLSQNYPNPFNPSTMIEFAMPTNGHARLEIFNVLGASVAVVFDGQALAGDHQVMWDGRDFGGNPTASGVYFYRLTADNYTETRKMMLLK